MRVNYENGKTSAKKLRLVFFGLGVVMALGTIGFIYLEDMETIDALYMTVITLSTVGFREVHPLHYSGKIFVIFLITFGVALVGYTLSVFGEWILEGQLRDLFGRKKMESRLKKLSGHYIIAGYGRVGRQVAGEFQKRSVSYVVIEKGEKALTELADEETLFVEGDATDEEVLVRAGIGTARTLISTLPEEAQNVYLTLTARDMNRSLNIIARADYEGGEKKLVRAGANHVVTPHILGGMRMAMASLRPNVVDFMHVTALGEGGLSVEEIKIPVNSKFSGQSLVDSKLKRDFNVTIIGIKKSGQRMNIAPQPDTVLEEQDILVLVGPNESLERLSLEMQ
ncbi:MAG: potassium channel protein [bacterium]|nr:potassium channel protein [bacterium]